MMDNVKTTDDVRAIPEPAFEPEDHAHQADTSSLIDDVSAVFEDGKTYAQAELSYQKTRARFVGGETKNALVFGVGALGAAHLALIALTVGLVLALGQLVGFWLSTLIVVVVYLIVAVVLGKKMMAKVSEIRNALSEQNHD